MRRIPVCSALSLVLFLVGLAARAESYDWPQWQGPTRNGLTKETGLLKRWQEGGPPRRWLFDKCGAGYAGPAIVDGRLYILGARDGVCQLIAIDANTGDELWARSLGPEFHNDWGNGPRSTPAVDDGRVYALSAAGTLICVEASDRHELWRVTMESLGGTVPNWGYSESVLIDGDKVLCTPGGPHGAIAAIDKETGKVIWQSEELTDFAHYSSIVCGEFHRQPQYVQLLEKRLVGLSPEDGKLLWEVEWPGSVAVIPTPIVRGNRVFVTSGYGAGCMLVEVSANNEATKVFENKRMKSQHGGVINLGNFLYGFSDDVGWVCMNARTGDLEWRERDALGKGAIGYADGRFYCVDQSEGNVVLIDASPKGWTERGRFTLEPQSQSRSPRGGIWVHPVIVDGKLFLRDQEYLYCYDVKK
ncbi:MAG: PQQ-like beta-propeller repeat protein [Planctomycetes bacterium]|nr:PQQ-like beta-propeller repeat protein [Planctomycetota bacterium]